MRSGLLEALLTEGLTAQPELTSEALDAHAAPAHLARHIAHLLQREFATLSGAEQVHLARDLIDWLHARTGDLAPDQLAAGDIAQLALSIGAALPRPRTGLTDLVLYVNGRHEPRVGDDVARELASADSVDLLCAFIRWQGIRVLEKPLADLLARGAPLRVITTTYLASTEAKPLEWLIERGAQVRISYDTGTTRLHAKAWLVRRDTGYSTAFIGSSNLSRSAMLDGVEWNVRLTQPRAADVLAKFHATFETYWNDDRFEPYERSRFAKAIASESATAIDTTFIDVHPLPHQVSILEKLDVERLRHNRWRNLVVAATGTGKTIIAALDFRRWRERRLANGESDTLLFVAHRKEILEQSLRAFRTVMKDGAFGELYVDGHKPSEWKHVFASIQSLSAEVIASVEAGAFAMVIVDEFHHAAAPSYDALLTCLKPHVLLGLTATPERADGDSVLTWFDGHIAAELRLWDALDQSLLVPFHYFGVHDDVDLSHLEWKRGGYDRGALAGVYTGNDARVAKVIAVLSDKVGDLSRMRALGFCVSIEHARFMALRFTQAGVPSVSVSADTPADERRQALRDLRDRRVRVVFAVDLFNEGVDVPEVDTILLLRPTESPTVFLQQLGRGLRRSTDKPCCTIFDFIGQQHRRFRFAERFGALLGVPAAEVAQHVEEEFPFLPSGSHIQLDRVARDIIVQNIRQSLRDRNEMAERLREWGDISLADFLKRSGLSLEDLYRSGRSFGGLRRSIALEPSAVGPSEEAYARGFARMLHIDDPERLAAMRSLSLDHVPSDERALRVLRMMLFAWRGLRTGHADEAAALADLRAHPLLVAELRALAPLLEDRASVLPRSLAGFTDVPLWIHAHYQRDEVLAALGKHRVGKAASLQSGVWHDTANKADILFITLNKSEKLFSPTTMYRDYAISRTLFHWESQSVTREQSPTGQRYIHHAFTFDRILLFVREANKDPRGETMPFTFLGPAHYVSHKGERPMAITWELEHAMPGDVLEVGRVVA